MQLSDFKARMEAEPDLDVLAWGLDLNAPDPVVVVAGQDSLGKPARWGVTVSEIRDQADADDMVLVFQGRRPPRILRHMTRIVGYYSFLDNWNGSKLAELHDRHKGDYEVQALAS